MACMVAKWRKVGMWCCFTGTIWLSAVHYISLCCDLLVSCCFRGVEAFRPSWSRHDSSSPTWSSTSARITAVGLNSAPTSTISGRLIVFSKQISWDIVCRWSCVNIDHVSISSETSPSIPISKRPYKRAHAYDEIKSYVSLDISVDPTRYTSLHKRYAIQLMFQFLGILRGKLDHFFISSDRTSTLDGKTRTCL